jgi:cyclopropane fatty-acyl-phospholipid synthase-like methyltransferase
MERSSRSLAETYDSIAQQWDDAHANELWWVPGAERFLQLVPAGPLLDVGCGCGYEARFYADHAREVVGIDISCCKIDLALSAANL